jgi:hypothetical protein
MLFLLDTLSWLQAVQFLLLFLNDVSLVEYNVIVSGLTRLDIKPTIFHSNKIIA